MKSRSRELLDRAIAAMVAAIDVYNKPDFRYRAESFAILALNAWELLLKAKWLAMNRNRLSSLYVREGKGSKRPRYKRTRSGSPFTRSLVYLAKKLTEQKVLDEACRKNLEALAELRDTTVHFYHRSPELGERVQEIGMAAVKNFASAAQDWFNEDLSRFNFYLMPLSFVTPPPATQAVELNKEEKNFLRYVRNLDDRDSDPNARYSVAINIEVRFVRSKSAAATPVRVTNDPNAPAVRLTEEQIRERYPWDYHELTNRCRERYSDFKVEQKYHQLRKGLEAIVALPLNMFYNTGIATYVWVLTNRKPEHRKGRVQLIDATQWYKPLRKNLGKKNCELSEDDIRLIVDTFLKFEETEQSKIFPNAAFGYWKVTMERPLRLKGIDPERAYTPKEIKALRETAERADDAPQVIKKIHKPDTAPDPLRGLFEATIHGKPRVVEYEPDTELSDTRCLCQPGIEDLGGEPADDLLPKVEASV